MKKLISHDKFLVCRMIMELRETQEIFHDHLTEMELENHMKFLYYTKSSLSNAEKHLDMALECLRKLDTEDSE